MSTVTAVVDELRKEIETVRELAKDEQYVGAQLLASLAEEVADLATIDIIAECEKAGIDHARLKSCLDTKDNWGKLVHSFEYLTVLGIVEAAMAAKEVQP